MNLLLLRGARRRGETAVRWALGASRRRVAFQLLSESMLLAVLGGAAGVLVAYGLAELFRGATLVRLPPFEGLAPDVRVLGFASAAVLVAGLLAGSIPSLLASRADFSGALAEAGRRATAAGRALRSLMTIVQLALSLALVVAGLLLTRTIRNLYAVDLGLDASGVVTFPVNMLPARYSDDEAAVVARRAFDALSAVPGVEGVAFDMYGPFFGSRFMGRLSRPGGEDAQPVWVEQRFATPGYFAMLRIPLLAGREFRAGEWSTDAGDRIIVTQTLARELFGDIDPVGREVSVAEPGTERYTVIGVTGDLRMLSPQGEPDLVMFRTIAAAPLPLFTAMVRTRAEGAALNEALRQALLGAAPEIPAGEPASLERKLDERIGEPRLFARLLSVVSALAVLLATIGLYGVIAWTVAERTREIGIRMALGARAASVARLVFRQVGVLTGIGIAAGLLGAFWIARLLRAHLFGIDVLDMPTYVGAVLFFAIVALAGCLAPTLAATRVDPVRALRLE